MNKVFLFTDRNRLKITSEKLQNIKQTAFIGKCGIGPAHSLYLIVHGGIVLACDPTRTWKTWDGGCNVEVERFVDVEITAIEQEKE